MKKSPSFTRFSTLATLALTLAAAPLARADESAIAPPVSVENYVPDYSPLVERTDGWVDPTPEQVERYLQDKHEIEDQDGLAEDSEDFRIGNYTPDKAAGKIVVTVHKSANPEVAEYLDVVFQETDSADSAVAQKLFDNGTSNKALVSTAGKYGSKTYTTPNGYFGLDTLETMHHSSAYNNAPMPWSEFFNGGIALHGATPDEFNKLGQKASHGCVRMHPDNAHLLFNFVKAKGQSKVVVNVRDN